MPARCTRLRIIRRNESQMRRHQVFMAYLYKTLSTRTTRGRRCARRTERRDGNHHHNQVIYSTTHIYIRIYTHSHRHMHTSTKRQAINDQVRAWQSPCHPQNARSRAIWLPQISQRSHLSHHTPTPLTLYVNVCDGGVCRRSPIKIQRMKRTTKQPHHHHPLFHMV